MTARVHQNAQFGTQAMTPEAHPVDYRSPHLTYRNINRSITSQPIQARKYCTIVARKYDLQKMRPLHLINDLDSMLAYSQAHNSLAQVIIRIIEKPHSELAQLSVGYHITN